MFSTYRLLRRHIKLSEKRSVISSSNEKAKVIIGIFIGFGVLYMLFLAVILALGANSSRFITPYSIMYGIAPFMMVVDFLFRFTSQQTPAQMVKPYILTPLPKYSCIDCFIVNSLTSYFHISWFTLLVPYAYMTILFRYGFVMMVVFLLSFLVMILINSQWYIIVRTLLNRSILWWLLPIAIYGCAALTMYSGGKWDIENMFTWWSDKLSPLCEYGWGTWAVLLALFAMLILVNRRLQYVSVMRELSREEKTGKGFLWLSKASELFANHGETSEYVSLEIKSILRNKNPRKALIFSTITVIFFSCAIAFTSIYDTLGMQRFLYVYCLCLFSVTMLSKVMSYEANYIDFLMVHKENIISLLKAKYYIYSVLILLPFLLLMPAVISGKTTLLTLIGLAFYTAGVQNAVTLQLAVYNNTKLPLNTKLTAKSVNGTNYKELLVVMFVMFFPLLFIKILDLFLSETMVNITLLTAGLITMLTNSLWIRNIYNRMQKNRYKTLEAFHK